MILDQTAIIDFVKCKLSEAEHALKCRQEMHQVWRGGSNQSWQKAGCSMTKSQRLKESEMQARIAIKAAFEVDMFRELLKRLETTE